MQNGSLVVVLLLPEKVKAIYLAGGVRWLPVDDESTEYTIRSIGKSEQGKTCVVFEEQSMGVAPDGLEFALEIKYVREVQAPFNFEEILECCRNTVPV